MKESVKQMLSPYDNARGGPRSRHEQVRERDICFLAVLCYNEAIYKGLYGVNGFVSNGMKCNVL